MENKLFLHTNSDINDMCDKILRESSEPIYDFDKYINKTVKSSEIKTLHEQIKEEPSKSTDIPFIPEL